MKRFVIHCVAAAAAMISFGAVAQVKMFDRPPTLEELRASMAAPAPAAAPAPSIPNAGEQRQGEDRVRSRAIVWNQPAAAAAAPAAAGAVAAQAALPSVASQAPSAQHAAAGNVGQPVAMPINFEPGSSRLVGQANAFIEPIAMLMRADPTLRMVVEGHTDSSGSPSRNLMLSWDRAMTVFKVLVERYGIDPVRLQPMGKGSMEPIDAGNPEGAVNRRVQFRPIG
jgi:outer membrane protein OmpA-like peptidoglycan-associated protein